MIDKRIGLRIKERRESLGLTQEAFAEKIGVAANYISSVERGKSFPRCENLIQILNGLETSADAIFCDVLLHSSEYKESFLYFGLRDISPEERIRILEIMEFLIKAAKEREEKK